MKKLIIALTIMTATIAPIKKAEAAMIPIYTEQGFILSMYPVMGGLALMFNKKECRAALCIDKIAGLALFLGGIALLNEESGTINFSELTEEIALEMGINERERLAFNESLEEINIVKDEIMNEVLMAEEKKLEVANELWSESIDFLDQDAHNAVKKVRAHIGRQLTKKN